LYKYCLDNAPINLNAQDFYQAIEDIKEFTSSLQNRSMRYSLHKKGRQLILVAWTVASVLPFRSWHIAVSRFRARSWWSINSFLDKN